MTRVIHTGDTHLGYRQYHSPERRQDFLAAFETVIDDAVSEDVDAVIHAGDLFHDRQPSLVDVHGAIEILRTLRDAHIPFLAIVGNHERTRDQQWLDLFETLGLATRLGHTPVELGDTALYGLDYVPRSKRESLDYDFEPTDAEHAALVAHGLFEPFAYADWDTETVLSESNIDFDAMLLGDNHEPDQAEVGDTWVTYCGSTERTGADERTPRGYNVVEFGEQVSIRRRGLDTREFVFLDVTLSSGEGSEHVRERVREVDVEDAVVIIGIDGDGEEIPVARIEEFATDRGALIARVTDRREFESAEAGDIQFADPDDAVRERLRELGPSEAALGLDETIRDRTVADSNVRERATMHVRDLLESDPDAFTSTAEVAIQTNESDSPDANVAARVDDGPSADHVETSQEEASAASEPTTEGPVAEASAGSSETDSAASDGTASDDGATEDGQVTMEDYL